LVEHFLAKEDVASSSLVARSNQALHQIVAREAVTGLSKFNRPEPNSFRVR
jgi:hypothetical protein